MMRSGEHMSSYIPSIKPGEVYRNLMREIAESKASPLTTEQPSPVGDVLVGEKGEIARWDGLKRVYEFDK